VALYEPDRTNKNFNNREPKKEGTHKQKYFGRNVGNLFLYINCYHSFSPKKGWSMVTVITN